MAENMRIEMKRKINHIARCLPSLYTRIYSFRQIMQCQNANANANDNALYMPITDRFVARLCCSIPNIKLILPTEADGKWRWIKLPLFIVSIENDVRLHAAQWDTAQKPTSIPVAVTASYFHTSLIVWASVSVQLVHVRFLSQQPCNWHKHSLTLISRRKRRKLEKLYCSWYFIGNWLLVGYLPPAFYRQGQHGDDMFP